MFLKNGGIYRINYIGWKTTPMPIIFVLYSGPVGNKIHGLYLNSNTNSRVEFVKFVAALRSLSNIGDRAISNPRALYRTLKKYCPNFIRTSYRTLFRAQVNKFALVSYGLTKPEDYTELERIKNDPGLFQKGTQMMQTRIVNTTVPSKKVGADFYVPASKVQEKTTVPTAPITTKPEPNQLQQKNTLPPNQTNIIQRNAGDQIEGY